MTSKEFYKAMDQCLEPECRRLGFLRSKGTTSLWHIEIPTGTFFYEVAKGVKNAYLPPMGGRFKVHCDVTRSPNRGERGVATFMSYMEYLSEADLEAMKGIQDRILTKIVEQTPFDPFEQQMLEAHSPLLRLQIGSQFRRNAVFSVPYLDKEDVAEWGGFLASRLDVTLNGVRSKPAYLFTSQGS